jgi:hypothetical protein
VLAYLNIDWQIYKGNPITKNIKDMRIWSVHPMYLDTKGLVALWREALLAKHVLEGKTKGYKNHPQLIRFKNTENPIDSINQYLFYVYNEAINLGYQFDKNKINREFRPVKITVTSGQIEFEKRHLLKKLQIRDVQKYNELVTINEFILHPIFAAIEGEIEEWEKV